MTKLGNMLIRADAGGTLGTGHVMRCLALAQAWQAAGGDICFVMATHASALETRLQAEGMQIIHLSGVELGNSEDAAATVLLAQQLNASRIVVDGYHFGCEYQKYLKTTGLHVTFIDDHGHANAYMADIVLNQNIHARTDFYARRTQMTQLLLGTTYALLRREFWPWQDWQRQITPIAHKILVTLGGSDPDNVTQKVVMALNQLSDSHTEALVVVGGQNPLLPELATAVGSNPAIQLRQNVANMPELMAWADIAISAGGSTCWELAFMGLPALVLVLADNQQPLAAGLDEAGAIINLGWHHLVSVEQIAQAVRAYATTRRSEPG
jgi:UDP-2,4-diacetamido-2,4,6-trideoxy-beta-L-altropyranose hydrolase